MRLALKGEDYFWIERESTAMRREESERERKGNKSNISPGKPMPTNDIVLAPAVGWRRYSCAT